MGLESEILLEIREKLKGARSLKKIRSIVSESFNNFGRVLSSPDLRDFKYRLSSKKWVGVIYVKKEQPYGINILTI
ncbi:hypothetical protein DRO30_02580 [Candidatus Bathyarchaeota archaeon]|nr:MAG: hypothetical protein DRO30_02580 [Candidatus Bathyarchaeota archaeon]